MKFFPQTEPGGCPWCIVEAPTREWMGIPLHLINVENPVQPDQVIGVEVVCLKINAHSAN